MIYNYDFDRIKKSIDAEEEDEDLTTWDPSGLMDYFDNILLDRWKHPLYIEEYIASFSEEEADGMAACLIKTDSTFCEFDTASVKSYVTSAVMNYLRDWIVSSLQNGNDDVWCSDTAYILHCISNAISAETHILNSAP